MIVQHNMSAINANRTLGVVGKSQAKSTEKLSSGYRINRAADDAAGLSISEKMRNQIKGLDRASLNAQDGISMIQTAEGALTEVHSMLQRIGEIATQASNGTNTSVDRAALNDEVAQLRSEIQRVVVDSEFNDKSLLRSGQAVTLQIGANKGQNIQFTVPSMSINATGMNIRSIQVTNSTVAGNAMSLAKSAIKYVSKQRSALGAVQNRLEHTIKNLDTSSENLTAAESRIRDTDMAKEMVQYTKNQILSQAGQSMLSQANQSTQGVLSLLQ